MPAKHIATYPNKNANILFILINIKQ